MDIRAEAERRPRSTCLPSHNVAHTEGLRSLDGSRPSGALAELTGTSRLLSYTGRHGPIAANIRD